MTICRYFLKGTCRFGDNCRFEHTESNYDSYGNNSAGYQDRHGQYGRNYQQSNQNRYESRNSYGGQSDRYSENYRHESPSRYSENYRTESPSRYYENYRTESPSRYSSGAHSNERLYAADRYSDSYRNEAPRYSSGTYSNEKYGGGNYTENQRNYSAKIQYAPSSTHYEKKGQRGYYSQQEAVEGANAYGQNKYKWVANELKKQSHPRTYENDYSTSTPKGGLNSFSFKLPQSEIKKTGAPQRILDEQDQISSEITKEDAKAWELGGLWPFTCYFPIPNKPAFPGFSDLSPEELRYAAYKAKENNVFESYVQAVQNTLAKIKQQMAKLQIPTPDLIDTLRKIWDGEDLCSGSDLLGSIPFLQYEASGTGVMPNAFPVKNAAASFSFKMATETDSSSKSSASASFSFKMPTEADSSSKSSAAAFSFKQPSKIKELTGFGGDPEIYTPVENLTEEEIEQFRAPTFVLGKIPTKPPPQMLCA